MLKPGDQITDQFIPSPWLAESIPRKSPFFPQIGDILMYFKQGHERYVDLVKERKAHGDKTLPTVLTAKHHLALSATLSGKSI